MSPPISIITVTYYTGPVLFDMLGAALAQQDVGELILVNNGNPLPIYQRLKEMSEKEPRLKLISGQGNVGFATACNLGAKEAQGEYLLFLNPDCLLPKNIAGKLLAESRAHQGLHLLGARILEAGGKEQSGSRRAALTPWTAFVEVLQLYRLFPNHPYCRRFKWHEEPVPAQTIPMPAISGALMFMHKEEYMNLGGMDEGYFLHVDDLDLCLRVQRAGGQVLFMPEPAVTHIGATSQAPATIVEWHKTRSFVRYFFKNFSEMYPRFFLWLVSGVVWMRFFVRALRRQFV
ncbi:MAG: glycosyltransferase family 2 protein [Proteobacteria bacterium]|nr:glycosyltransferase family 2 protein [Pseudomonadota bacterium]